MKAKVGISDTGMATAVTAVARQSRRKSQTTSAASAMPSSMVSRVAAKLPRVSSTVREDLGDADVGWVGASPGHGRRAVDQRCSAASTPSSVVTSLASLVLVTWKPTTGRPSNLRLRAHLRRAVADVGDVGQLHEAAAGRRQGEVANLVDGGRRAQHAQRLLAPADLHAAAGGVLADVGQRLVDLRRGHPLGGHPRRVDDDVDLAVDAADRARPEPTPSTPCSVRAMSLSTNQERSASDMVTPGAGVTA